MLSKLETVVVVFMTMASCASFAAKSDSSGNGTSCTGPDSPYARQTQLEDQKAALLKDNPGADTTTIDAAIQKASDKYDQCIAQTSGSDSGATSCSTASKDLNKIASDLFDNCPIHDCDSFADCTDEDKKAAASSSNKADVDSARSICSALASGDLDKIQDQLNKDKDRLSSLKKAASEANNDLQKAGNQANDKLAEARNKMAENASDSADKIQELKDKEASQESQLKQKQLEAQNKIDELNAQIGQKEVDNATAYAKMLDAKASIMMNCQNAASSQVGAMQAKVLAEMQTNTYNRGNEINFLSNVGMSDRASWQRVAQKYVNWCLESTPTLLSEKSADMAFSVQLLATAKAKDALNRQILTATIARDEVQNGQGCSPLIPPTEMCASLAQNQAAITAESLKLQQKQDAAAQNASQAALEAQQQKGQAATDAQQAQSEYNDEKTRTDNLQKYLDARLAAGGELGVSAKDVSVAYGKFQKKKKAAEFLLKCANIDPTKASGASCPTTSKMDMSQCDYALQFMQHVNNPKNPNRYDYSGGTTNSSTDGNNGSTGGTTSPRDN